MHDHETPIFAFTSSGKWSLNKRVAFFVLTLVDCNTADAVKSANEVVEEEEEEKESKEEAKLGEEQMTFRHDEVAQVHLDWSQA